ncbi:hypothetical protein ACAG96_03495 [Candidatus Izemoplasma sp. B36]|uniref:hypothetical protein n=1 Tax=Candidatus Izemoplasma sp. B36 TaxID=3242468 RepID=UPI00355873F0
MLSGYCDILVSDYGFRKVTKNIYKGVISEVLKGKELYSFHIQVDLNPILKNMLPTVTETENLIPNNIDNHKYTYNNSFCFGVGLHERIIFNKMIKNFKWFMEKQVKGFLSAYILKDLTGVWGGEEFSHNELKARKESLQKLLGVYNFTLAGLNLVEQNIIYKIGKCYCGSGKEYIGCHFEKLSSLRRMVSLQDILYELYRIRELIKNENS